MEELWFVLKLDAVKKPDIRAVKEQIIGALVEMPAELGIIFVSVADLKGQHEFEIGEPVEDAVIPV